jgi:hypothetical protein
MKIKEILDLHVKVEKLVKGNVKKVKEVWYYVGIGDKNFSMPKDLLRYFVVEGESIFHLYFDGDRLITDDPHHIPITVNKENVKKCRFIRVSENAELWNPEDYTLITKDGVEALYTVNHDNDIMYRNGKEYTILYKNNGCFYEKSVIFDVEKPLNEETFNLIRRIHNRKDKSKHVCIPENYSRFEVKILDDVGIYVGEKHYFMVLENAEIVRVLDDGNEELIAIKGDKTYLEIDRWHAEGEDEVNFVKDGNRYLRYVSKYRMFDYDFNMVNVLKIEERNAIAEIPSLDADITVRKFVINVEPVLIDTYPKTWHFEKLDPELVGEKVYKLRHLVRKLDDTDKYGYDYRVDIGLAVNV